MKKLLLQLWRKEKENENENDRKDVAELEVWSNKTLRLKAHSWIKVKKQ